MTIRSGIRDALLLAAGAAAFALVFGVALHFRPEADPSAAVAARARRADVVAAMQVDLAIATEAEKNAVLAVTDDESQAFADRARAGTASVDRGLREIGDLLNASGTPAQRDLLGQFSEAFAALQRVDDELLRLAVRNTNLKAWALLFGPAAQAAGEMDGALAGLRSDATGAGPLADDARIAALRIQTLLAPHIAEESAEKMDALEARIAREDEEARGALDGLRRLAPDRAEAAAARYARFSELKTQILALSRENSDLRSVSMSLAQKQRVLVLCQAALVALRKSIQDEPIPGVRRDDPIRPR